MAAATRIPRPGEVHQAFHEELHPTQQSALISWVSFTTTFAAVRVITHRIRAGEGRLKNVNVGGVHLHHYLWGILMVSLVGATTIRGSDRFRRHPVTATAYGAGLALIVDEFALLLDLKDVYWAKQGRDSVDLAIGLIAGTGSVLAALPVLRRLQRNRR
jgi:hypothetical protein